MRRQKIYTHCLLFLALTFSFIAFSTHDASSATVGSVIDGHNTCAQCHSRYPGAPDKAKSKGAPPAKIPADKVDLLCMGCHGPAGISMLKADTHGAQNYVVEPIGCIDCHDPHDNVTNYVGGHNIKLIGNGQSVVFESRGSDTGDSALYSFADDDMDNDGTYSGICEVCHTQTKFHKNNKAGDHGHFTGQTCTNCHVHINQFLAFSDSPISEPEISGVIIDESGNTRAGITLFIDLNGNGKFDDGEPTATTDANGNFTFKGVPNKGYGVLLMPGTISDAYNVKISIVNNVVIITLFANKMAYPTRLSWNPAGGYLVADFLLNSIFFYDSSDNLLRKLKGLDHPLSVATDSTGSKIYVGNKGRRNVEVYNATDQLLMTMGDGELKMPNDIVFDRNRIYVVDSQNKQIRVFNTNGTNTLIISQTDPGTQPFAFPKSLAIHYRMEGGVEIGELYVADKPTALIHVFNLKGTYQRTIGGKLSSSSLGGWKPSTTFDKFANIQSIAFDQNGNLNVLDSSMDRVKIIDPLTGAGVGYYNAFLTGQSTQLPLDIAINDTGQVIMTSFKTKSVQHIHTVQ